MTLQFPERQVNKYDDAIAGSIIISNHHGPKAQQYKNSM